MTAKDKITVLSTVPIPQSLIDRWVNVSPQLRFSIRQVEQASEIPAEMWAEAEVLITDQLLPDPNLAPKLRWVQFLRASLEHVFQHPILKIKDMRLTTISGANAPQGAEKALMSLLALARRVPQKLSLQNKAQWDKKPWQKIQPITLNKRTVGIVGYGSVGRELARLLQVLEVKILAAKYDATQTVDEGFTLEGKGDPEGRLFKRLYPYQAIRSMLKECDFVVITVPLTDKSRQLISRDVFEVMKPGAFLVNISHKQVVDEKSLIEALVHDRLGGAVLSMEASDPPAAESPLWNLKNIIIDPRIRLSGEQVLKNAAVLITENFERYTNRTSLLNRFDPDKGY